MVANAMKAERERVDILGFPIDRVTMAEAMTRLEAFLSAEGPNIVVTADASGLVAAQSDPEYAAIIREASLVTPDSIGVLWAANRRKRPLTERVSGVDLVAKLCALSADKGYRIFLLGAAPGVAELAGERLKLQYPGCNIVGTRNGFFPAESDEIVAAEVAATRPDILFVAMGIPRQEKFIKKTQGLIGAKIAMGVGGSLDVHSGIVKRAPQIIQKLRLEWLWRLILNPKKIGKVKALPIFFIQVLRSK